LTFNKANLASGPRHPYVVEFTGEGILYQSAVHIYLLNAKFPLQTTTKFLLLLHTWRT